MSHDAHEALPGYHPEQLLVDGCGECESRSTGAAIAHMDPERFGRAWKRAVAWNREGAPAVSQAECGVLSALWSVAVQLEMRGVPIGVLPRGVLLAPADEPVLHLFAAPDGADRAYPACNKRWLGRAVSQATSEPERVTCGLCRRTKAYAAALAGEPS